MTLQELFDEACQPLVRSGGAERGRIFHSQGLKMAGHFFAFVRADELVVKLTHERVAALIDQRVGQAFDAGKGRPMREWVCLRPADSRTCRAYLEEASKFAARNGRRLWPSALPASRE